MEDKIILQSNYEKKFSFYKHEGFQLDVDPVISSYDVRVIDFNGDGLPDLMAIYNNSVEIFMYNPVNHVFDKVVLTNIKTGLKAILLKYLLVILMAMGKRIY